MILNQIILFSKFLWTWMFCFQKVELRRQKVTYDNIIPVDILSLSDSLQSGFPPNFSSKFLLYKDG